MAENIAARDLMVEKFATIGADDILREAMRVLVSTQTEPELPRAVVVLDSQGQYEGLLTARLLFKSLLNLWSPGRALRKDEARLEQALLAVVRDRVRVKVRDALVRGLPTARPGERVLSLVELACDQQLEYVPVVENGKARGLVPVTRLFHAVSSLALTPEHEGIRMDGKAFP